MFIRLGAQAAAPAPHIKGYWRLLQGTHSMRGSASMGCFINEMPADSPPAYGYVKQLELLLWCWLLEIVVGYRQAGYHNQLSRTSKGDMEIFLQRTLLGVRLRPDSDYDVNPCKTSRRREGATKANSRPARVYVALQSTCNSTKKMSQGSICNGHQEEGSSVDDPRSRHANKISVNSLENLKINREILAFLSSTTAAHFGS